MLVFWKANLVLLAVPKTGTTALEGALAPRADMVFRNPPEIKHAPLYRYRRFLKPLFVQAGRQEPDLMAVVRHPIDWLGSWYRYRSRADLAGHANSTRDVSFDEFVTEYCRGKPASFANVGAQSRFVLDGDGVRAVEHLFRYEDQPRIAAFLEDRLGGPVRTRPQNVSPQRETPLGAGLETKLRTKHAAEFAVWEMAGD